MEITTTNLASFLSHVYVTNHSSQDKSNGNKRKTHSLTSIEEQSPLTNIESLLRYPTWDMLLAVKK